jgi:hypothetical protein
VPGDDEALELLRSQSGLSIDDEGRFLHRGEVITHARTREVLWRSLERTPDGRWLVRVGRESGYVSVVETPWIVRAIADGPGAEPILALSDGTSEPLDPASLRLGGDGILRCAVKGGAPARFARAAQLSLGLRLEEDPPGSGTYYLTAGARRWPVTSPGR